MTLLGRSVSVEPPSEGALGPDCDLALHSLGSGPRLPRLLHVFPNFTLGGAQMRFAILAEHLSGRFSHTVLSLDGRYDAADFAPASDTLRLAGDPPTAGALPSRLHRYRHYLADQRPDLLITYNWGAIEFALANRLYGASHVHMEDGFGPEEAERQLARRVWGRRLALSRSQVVVPSLSLKTIAADVWRLDPRTVHHIPNGVEERNAWTTPIATLGLPPAVPRIVWVGALRPEKNPIRLLRAFAPVSEQAVLVVIGDGPERDSVEREVRRLRIDRRVWLLGRRPDSRDLLAQCDILALSSDTEQMPLVVLEAMDAGLAIASSDVGDVRRMVANENRPLIVPASAAALASVLQRLVGDKTLRNTLGEANRSHVRRTYPLRKMVRTYADLFERMTKRVARPRGHV